MNRAFTNALCMAFAIFVSAAATAAVPLSWEVKPGQASPVAFDRFHGESLQLSAEFVGFSEPPFASGADVRLWYQTNGMGSAWWSAPASVDSNMVSAVWSPELDPGAERVNLFFGAPSNAYCSAVLRLRGSPGMVPNVLPLPVQRLDYAAIEVANAPYYTKSEADAKIVELAPSPGNYAAVSNAAMSASSAAANAYSSATNNAEQSYVKKTGDTTINGTLTFQGGGFGAPKTIVNNSGVSAKSVTLGGGIGFGQSATLDSGGVTITSEYSEDPERFTYPLGSGGGTFALAQHVVAATNGLPSWAKASSKPSYSWSEITSKPTFATVATSGSYNDLSNKPTIPDVSDKADDDDVVHKSGAETIEGAKTFTDNMTAPFINSGLGSIMIGLSGRIKQLTAGGLLDDTILPNYGEVKSAISAAAQSATNYTDAATNALAVGLVEYIESPETVRTNYYTGVSRDSALRDGKMVLYHNLTQATGNWTLDLTLAGGAKTGAKPVYTMGTSQATTRYTANAVIPLVYRAGAWYVSDYDSNSDTFNRNLVSYCKARYAISANTLVVGTTNGYQQVSTNVAFDINYPILFCNGAQTAGKTNGNNWFSDYTGINLAYTWAGWGGDATTRGRPVFLVGSLDDVSGTFIIDPVCPFSLDARPPCYCLGFYNANSNGFFSFLPGPLMREEPDLSGYAAASDVAANSADIADLKVESSLVYRLYSGSNVVCEVTNYNSAVHSPTMRLLQLGSNGVYSVVWTEANNLHRVAQAATNYTDAAISAATNRFAPRAWSGVTSGLGVDAPPATTWISTPTTVLAGGYEYQKAVTSAGAVWVLTSNGMTTLGPSANGSYLDIAAADGTSVFRIEKTDSYLVGASADGITVSGNTVTISVPVVAGDHPYLRYAASLESPVTWYKEEESDIPGTVGYSWSGSSGAWVCTVTTANPSGFFYFEFLQQGTTKIVNNGVTDLSGGIWYNGVKYMPHVSGNELKFVAE